MAKNIGLSRNHKKMFEFLPFPPNTPQAGLLYNQAICCYTVFRKNFGHGYLTVFECEIPNLEAVGINLILYHLAVELMLKALISLKNGKFEEVHDIYALLKRASKIFPNISRLIENIEYELLIRELSAWCIHIRYAEGSLTFRHNNKRGWQSKKPFQEFSEALEDIFNTLKQAFDEAAARGL
jgi:HEPN domain-containing protein